jgi:hypothetical protein
MRSPAVRERNAQEVVEFATNVTGSNTEKVDAIITCAKKLAWWNDDVPILINMACKIAKENPDEPATYELLQAALTQASKGKSSNIISFLFE